MDSFVPDERTALQRIKDNDWYIADDSVLDLVNRASKVIAEFERVIHDDPIGAQEHLRQLFANFGSNSFIRSGLRVDYGVNVHWRNNSFANFGLVLLDVAPIHIGDNVLLGTNVQLLTPIHPLDPEKRKAGWESAKPIYIQNNVWIGSGAIVLPGVTIGENSVVGAGSVVTKDVEPGVVVVGNPARVVKSVSN